MHVYAQFMHPAESQEYANTATTLRYLQFWS